MRREEKYVGKRGHGDGVAGEENARLSCYSYMQYVIILEILAWRDYHATATCSTSLYLKYLPGEIIMLQLHAVRHYT